jgi:hypothetical protein
VAVAVAVAAAAVEEAGDGGDVAKAAAEVGRGRRGE